ncbi:MAG: aldehyde dehydrogenase family protein [Geminicoccaceae bacterium]
MPKAAIIPTPLRAERPLSRGERRDALLALADAIEREGSTLADSMVATTLKARRVADGDISLAVRRLRAIDELLPQLENREAAGTVAIVFPSNVGLANPASTIGAAFLAGNRVHARFPSGLRDWGRRVERLFSDFVSDLSFDHGPAPDFLRSAILGPDVDVIMVFGDDSWAKDYEPLVRQTGKTFIFEGPGKDPFVVLPGADIEKAAQDAVRGAYYNAGQACTSPERFIVHESLVNDFTKKVLDLTRLQRLGLPEDQRTTVGPIASTTAVARIRDQLADAREKGANVLCGGGTHRVVLRNAITAAFVEPTVIADVTEDMTVVRDETFGPVIPIMTAGSVEDALRIANDSRYGLAASIYGGKTSGVDRLAAHHGPVFRNEIWIDHYGRHVHAPLGGRKASGWTWSSQGSDFVRREGLRRNIDAFSRPLAVNPLPQPRIGTDHA